MWAKRKPRQPREVVIQHRGLEVRHTVERSPDPRPVMCWLVITNRAGQQYRTYPMPISGSRSMTIAFPVDWLGDLDPHGQVRVELELEY